MNVNNNPSESNKSNHALLDVFPVLSIFKNAVVSAGSYLRGHWEVIVFLVFFGLIIYARSFHNPYVYDDKAFLRDNMLIRSIGNVKKLISPYDYFLYSRDITYRPVPFLLNMINYSIWGEAPFGHRVTSTLLHVINGILIYFLVLLLLKEVHNARMIGLIAALFFIAHPVQSESVFLVSFNETLLVNIFYILTLITYILSVRYYNNIRKRIIYFTISIILYLSALFSKETAVTLPIILIVYDICFDKNRNIKKLLLNNAVKYLSYILVTCCFLLLRFFLYRHPLETALRYPGGTLLTNIATMLKVIPVYLKLIFLPVALSIEYKIQTSYSLFEPVSILGLFILIGLIYILILLYKKSSTLCFFYAWIFILLIPVSNIIPMQILAAERYLYASMLGVAVLVGFILQSIAKKKYIYIVMGILLSIYIIIINVRINDWKDEFTFWKKAVSRVPYSDGAHNGLGWAFMGKKDFNAAISEFKQSLKLKPDYFEAQNSLAAAYYSKGDIDRAIQEYYTALKMNPHMPVPHLNLGIIYKNRLEYNNSIKEFKLLVLKNSSFYQAYAHLGDIYKQKGSLVSAVVAFSRAIQLNPDFALPYNSLGVLFGEKGRYDVALPYLQKAVALDPDSCEFRFNLAYIYYLSGNYKSSIIEVKKVLESSPDFEKAHYLFSLMQDR